MKLSGFAHVYPRAHINTDEIIPARYLTSQDPEFLGKHALEDLDREFVRRVRPGDILVAGEDFGCGSSREHAVWALRAAGIQSVLAASFARIFFRNAINNGFLALECPQASQIVETGDVIELDLEAGRVRIINKNKELRFAPLSPFARQLIDSGGLLAVVRRKLQARSPSP